MASHWIRDRCRRIAESGSPYPTMSRLLSNYFRGGDRCCESQGNQMRTPERVSHRARPRIVFTGHTAKPACTPSAHPWEFQGRAGACKQHDAVAGHGRRLNCGWDRGWRDNRPRTRSTLASTASRWIGVGIATGTQTRDGGGREGGGHGPKAWPP